MTRDRVEAIDEKLVELEQRFNEVDREFRILMGTGPSIKPVPKSDTTPEAVQVTQVKTDAPPKASKPPSPTKKAPPPVPEKKSSAKISPPSPKKSATQPPSPKKTDSRASPSKATAEPKTSAKPTEKLPTKTPPKAQPSPPDAPQPSKRTTSLAPTQKPTKRDLDSDDHDTYYDDETTFR